MVSSSRLRDSAQQAQVHHDGGENVVEIVGDAAGELADGLQLLHLAELRFQLPALGDVGEHGEGAAVLAGVVEQGRPGDPGPKLAPILVPEPALVLAGLARTGRRAGGFMVGQVGGINEIAGRPLHQFLGRITEHLGQAMVGKRHVVLFIRHPDAFVGGLDDLPVALVAGAQFGVGALAVFLAAQGGGKNAQQAAVGVGDLVGPVEKQAEDANGFLVAFHEVAEVRVGRWTRRG
jgi:hypothetical protein